MFSPKDRSSTYNRRPSIYMKIGNMQDVDYSSFRMYLNSKSVSVVIDKDGIKYTPRKQLKYGTYKVRINYKQNHNDISLEWEFNIVDKKDYKCYIGIPHSHTSYSGGKGTPSDAYKIARENKIDFLIVTEHYRILNKQVSKKAMSKVTTNNKFKDLDMYDLMRYEKKTFSKKNKKFLSLVGTEVPTKFYGHINVLNLDKNTRIDFRDISKFYEYMSMNNGIGTINHPSDKISKKTLFKDLDRYLCLIEIGNGSYGTRYNTYENTVYDLLDRGWILGVVNSQDNHLLNWGIPNNVTGVLLDKLKEDDLWDALRNRRTYATESKTFKIKYYVNDYIMGSIIEICSKDDIEVSLDMKDDENIIKSFDLITNNKKTIYHCDVNNKSYKGKFRISVKDSRGWILVKVILENNIKAYTSPIFY